MTETEDNQARPPRSVPYVVDAGEAELLARLTEKYREALPGVRERHPESSVPAVLHAVQAHQARRVLALDPRWRETVGEGEVPEDRAQDVVDALALLRVARADLEAMEGALLLAARTASARTGKPLLTFKRISRALGTESEQAAQGRYRRKVGNLNGTDAGYDGTP